LLGDIPSSFKDFQQLLVISPKDPLMHIYAGNLLMTNGAY